MAVISIHHCQVITDSSFCFVGFICLFHIFGFCLFLPTQTNNRIHLIPNFSQYYSASTHCSIKVSFILQPQPPNLVTDQNTFANIDITIRGKYFIISEMIFIFNFSMDEIIWKLKWSRDQINAMVLEQFKAFWQSETGIVRTQLARLEQAAGLSHAVIISGLRRAGKSTLLAQMAHQLGREQFYYLNFEDDRFITDELNSTKKHEST